MTEWLWFWSVLSLFGVSCHFTGYWVLRVLCDSVMRLVLKFLRLNTRLLKQNLTV